MPALTVLDRCRLIIASLEKPSSVHYEWMNEQKNIKQDTQVPRQNTNTCPKNSSKLLPWNRQIRHYKKNMHQPLIIHTHWHRY